MHKILVIAAREYKAAVRTKSFLIGILIVPIIWIGTGVVQYFLQKQRDVEDKRFAVVDRTPGQKLFPVLKLQTDLRNQNDIFDKKTGEQNRAKFILIQIEPSADTSDAVSEQRVELSDRAEKGEFIGFLDIGPDVCKLVTSSEKLTDAQTPTDRTYIRYQTTRPTYRTFTEWANIHFFLTVIRQRWIEAGIPEAKMVAVTRHVEIQTKGLSRRDAMTGEVRDPPTIEMVARYLVPFGLVMLMFLVIMIGATPAMQGIVEEKMQRIAEVLLGSVTPFALMLGKLIGVMGVSLTTSAVYLTGVYFAARHYEVSQYLSADILAWFLLFQVLALFMYGSVFLAIGAAATDLKETQTLLLPVMLVLCIPMMVLMAVIEDPNGTLAVATSYFPFVTPMMMMARIAVPPGIPTWQPLLGIVVVLATTTLCVYAAGRIFRVGILMQGKGAKFSDLIRWVWTG